MLNVYIPYNEYWNSKGKYGQERVRRKNLRKQKRKDKQSSSCKCGHNRKSSYYHPCPYSVEMYNNDSDMCNCCSECQYNCAMDV